MAVHYHFFKCAGTSVERTLRDNFGTAWRQIEGAAEDIASRIPWSSRAATDRFPLEPDALGRHLTAHPEILAVSSHTALLPPPEVSDVLILPIVFVRHPLNRIRSVYEFERQQPGDTLAANKAKETTLGGYIEWRLERAAALSDRSITNFLSWRLTPAGEGETLAERALSAVSRLPFVGVVERYDESLSRLQGFMGMHYRGLRLKAYRDNVTSGGGSPEDGLERLRSSIGQTSTTGWPRPIKRISSSGSG